MRTFGEITDPAQKLERERGVLVAYIDGLISRLTDKQADPGTAQVVDAFEQAVRGAVEDERNRFEFEADEATRKLVSARMDALREAAALCRASARKGHREFADELAEDVLALAAALPVRGSTQERGER